MRSRMLIATAIAVAILGTACTRQEPSPSSEQSPMATNEPGHTFFLVDGDGRIAWLRDYGAAEHGGAMYVPPDEIASQVKETVAES